MSMTFDEYQAEAMRVSVYPRVTRAMPSKPRTARDAGPPPVPASEELPVYPALAMCGEAGELAAKVADIGFEREPLPQIAYLKELGDVLWYLTAAARDLGFSLRETAVPPYSEVGSFVWYARELSSCANDLEHWTLDLVAKCGEFSELVKRAWRDGHPLDRHAAVQVLMFVFADLARIARLFYSDIAVVAQVNIDKIVDRRKRDAVGGSGDDR